MATYPRNPLVLCAFLIAGAAGCAPDGFDPEQDEAEEDRASALTTQEQAAILNVANTATFEQLDVDAGLDARAAQNIVDARPFATFAELDAVPYVGETALAKLLAYAGPPPAMPTCLVISEYVEGMGNYNKAVELFNCGTEPMDLGRVGICLVRNADTQCTVTRKLSAVTLEPGEVFGVCRSRTGTTNDPHPYIPPNCDQELPGVMLFDGDDRLLVFEDLDEDGTFYDAHDRPLDAFGQIAVRPPAPYWADRVLRRCNMQPFDGFGAEEFLPWEYFTRHARTALEDYGDPPSATSCP